MDTLFINFCITSVFRKQIRMSKQPGYHLAGDRNKVCKFFDVYPCINQKTIPLSGYLMTAPASHMVSYGTVSSPCITNQSEKWRHLRDVQT